MVVDLENIRYKVITKIKGPLVFTEKIADLKYGELVVVELEGEERNGRVVEVGENHSIIQVYRGTEKIGKNAKIKLTGRLYNVPVSESCFGRIFNGVGEPIDGGPEIKGEERTINSEAISPNMRAVPEKFLQTKISGIDLMNSYVMGQKLPIFSGSGLPHNQLISQMINQMENVKILFVGLGMKYEDFEFFKNELLNENTLNNISLFINFSSDPSVERIITPRIALAFGEFLAFERGHDVVVILSDMRNYCDALREVSNSLGEIPGRRGYPPYLYSDLASIYERSGIIKGKEGSLTQIPVLTMPGDDITHPIADLTGYITEGQIILSRELFLKGISPPIDVLPSLSRLMHKGISKEHYSIANKLYSSYAEAREVDKLAKILGEDSLTEKEKSLAVFSSRFENELLKQDFSQKRELEESLKLAENVLSAIS